MVLFVTLQLGGEAGVFKSALDVLSALLKDGEPVTVISARSDRSDSLPPSLNGDKTARVTLRHLPVRYHLSRLTFGKPFRSIRYLVELLRFATERFLVRHFCSPRFVLVNGLGSDDVWSAIRKESTVPKAIIVRESPRHFQSGTAAYSLEWAIEALSRYDYHIFVSENCRREWGAFQRLQGIPSAYVPNCCEEERTTALLKVDRHQVRRSLDLPSDRFVIMCVGSLQPRKGQDLVVERLAEIVEMIPRTLVCFVGADPLGLQPDLQQSIDRDGLADHVCFVPNQPSALEWIYAADALLLPSRAEAMPRVVLEAMALKTPVVAAAVDGVTELIEHERTGWLFTHEDLGEMIKGLAAASDQSSGPEMAEAAFKAYWQEFSRANLVQKYRRAFADIQTLSNVD